MNLTIRENGMANSVTLLGPNGGEIARVWKHGRGQEYARLFAASPELLKAAQGYLEIAQAILDGDEVEDETWEAIVADLKPLIDRAMVSEVEGKEG
jgi:hypothetical protein